MKKIICLVLSLFIFTSAISVSASETIALNDIEGHWAEESIQRIMNKGIISGYPDGSFKPDKSVTRAELAKIVTIAFNLDSSDSLEEFEDIDSTQWYYPYLEKSAHYIPKYRLPVYYPSMVPYLSTAGKFLPNNEAVRMHVAEALVEIMMDKDNIELDIPDIFDIQAILLERFNDEHYEELFVMQGAPAGNATRMLKYTWIASELGIMHGDDNGYFNPYGYITRAELVTIIDRIITE